MNSTFIPQHWPGAAAKVVAGEHCWKHNTFADALQTAKAQLALERFHRLNDGEKVVALLAIGAYTALGGEFK